MQLTAANIEIIKLLKLLQENIIAYNQSYTEYIVPSLLPAVASEENAQDESRPGPKL